MKFAHFSHVWRKPNQSPGERYAQLWRELEVADQVGFDYSFAVEHHVDPRESLSPSPPMYLASAAAHTERMRLGEMGWTVPLYDPLRVVEEVVALDHLTGGRLEVGLVSGALPQHFIPYKADFEHRRERAVEGYQLLKTACANPSGFSFKGEFHEYEDVALQMGPYQQPHPPVWFETGHPPTLEYMAKEGVGTGYVHYVPRGEMAGYYQEYVKDGNAAGHQAKAPIN